MPELTDLTVSYSVGVKRQIEKYELSADAHLSRTEKWNVSEMTLEEVDAFYAERYEALQADLGDKIVAKDAQLVAGDI